MDSATLQACKDTAEEVARAAGKMIREAHEQRAAGLSIESKGSTADASNVTVDLVTATDKACEVAIIDTIQARFPGHLFIGEESSFCGPGQEAPSGPLELTDAPTWIIDPLDGTTNFVHGYPLVTVSIGLAVGGECVLGVIYNPIMDELISAVKGGGAHLNGMRVSVGKATGVTDALVCNNLGASRKPEVNRQAVERLHALLQANVRGLRNTGSCAQNMMHVACGALDAYFEDGFGGPWDVAAGKVIVEEAGGVFRSHLGGPFVLKAGKGQVLAGNVAVVEDIARVLNSVEPSS
uniref:Inositol-1-monophosphatase n=1 Tax=Prymnesium polylepis TaxID=72548 RepID=A0A7S4J5E2_9EUKA